MCVKVTINNQVHEFEESLSILNAARSIGVDIPTLCHDERLKPIGSCRMCLVDVEGKPRLVTSCNTPLIDGMVVSTHTPALENERRMLLRMLAQDHPAAGLTSSRETVLRLRAPIRLNRERLQRIAPVATRRLPSLYLRRHVAVHCLLSLCADLRRGAGPVCLAGARERTRNTNCSRLGDHAP